MNVTFERVSAQDPSASSSLCWDERCFCVKNQRASDRLVIQLGMTYLMTIAHVAPSTTKCLLGVMWRFKHAAVISHVRLVLDAILSNLLHCLWRTGLVATSHTRWEACLPWMSPGWMMPAWGHSVLSPLWGVASHKTQALPVNLHCQHHHRTDFDKVAAVATAALASDSKFVMWWSIFFICFGTHQKALALWSLSPQCSVTCNH